MSYFGYPDLHFPTLWTFLVPKVRNWYIWIYLGGRKLRRKKQRYPAVNRDNCEKGVRTERGVRIEKYTMQRIHNSVTIKSADK